MRHLEGTPRSQTLLLPPSVEDYVPEDHPVRVIDAFVDSLNLSEMGFRKAQTARTGRRPYHPGDLLKLYIYAYLNQTSSTRRLEKECHRNLEVLWLMKQLAPDFKTIADFRKDNGDAVKKVCRQFIVFCKQAGLVSGQLVAIDGSKFKAAASKDQAITRKQLQKQLGKLDQKIDRYLDQLAASEQEGESNLNHEKVSEALAYLQAHKAELQDELKTLVNEGKTQHCRTEPDAKLMKSGREGMVVGYNAQNAVDEGHQLIVHHELTQAGNDTQQLKPMAQETHEALEGELETVVADAGYSNGEQINRLQSSEYDVAVPSNRAVNNQGTGEYFQKSDFIYLPEEDAYRCPAGQLLHHKTISNKQRMHLYARSGCHQCPLQAKCTKADRRWITRHFDEEALEKAKDAATPERMIRRMATVEPTFATLKRLLNKGRFTCWGLASAGSEYSLGVLSYNLMRAINVLGVKGMLARLA
ncbi:IS1182 family transposase [Marinobacter lipolyticus]|uniref:IS1182 family transposase n=1 Tax=Marinobacter lipolyticus TaxID=209639 RepID=UPI003A8DC02D